MGSHDEIRDRLAAAAEDAEELGEPFELMRSELASVGVADLPDGLQIQVIEKVDAKGTRYVTLGGTLRRHGQRMIASIEETGWRKGWSGPLGVEDYHALVLAAVEARAASVGDVAVTDVLDDNSYGVI